MMFSDSMLCASSSLTPSFKNLGALFNGGATDGIMIDLTDLTTLFQDQNGAVPVVSNGDSVGFALDQHKWGGKTLAEHRTAQPELVTNGDFVSDVSGWSVSGTGSISWDAGKLRLTTTSGSPYFYQSFSTVVGRWYEATIVFDSRVGTGNQALYIGTAAGSGANLSGANTFTTPGTYRRWFRASATTTFISVQSASTTTSSDWESVSIKEIDGHHATQTSTARPLWASATGDVAFDGSFDYLVTDFYFQDQGNFMASYFRRGAVGGGRTICGMRDTTAGEYSYLTIDSSGVPIALIGDSYQLNSGGAALPSAGPYTMLADQYSVQADLFIDGVSVDSHLSPGNLPDAARARGFFIGTVNSNGTPLTYNNGGIKRIVAGQLRLQDVMSAAEFHQNLIN